MAGQKPFKFDLIFLLPILDLPFPAGNSNVCTHQMSSFQVPPPHGEARPGRELSDPRPLRRLQRLARRKRPKPGLQLHRAPAEGGHGRTHAQEAIHGNEQVRGGGDPGLEPKWTGLIDMDNVN